MAVDQQSVLALFGNQNLSPDLLKQLLPQLQAMGIHVQNEKRGDLRPRLWLPDGTTVDLGDWGGPAKWVPRGNMGDWWKEDVGGGGPGAGGGSGPTAGGQSTQMTDLANTPGYQFALQQGLQGVERSAFARGTGLTGGTLKALMQYAEGLASQTYENRINDLFNLSKLGQQSIQ